MLGGTLRPSRRSRSSTMRVASFASSAWTRSLTSFLSDVTCHHSFATRALPPSLRPSGTSPPHRLQLLLTLKARQHALDQLAAFEPLLILQLLRACQEPDLSAALFARHALAGLVHLGSPAAALVPRHPMPSRFP